MRELTQDRPQAHFAPDGPFHSYLRRTVIDSNWFHAAPTGQDEKSNEILACVKGVLRDAEIRLNRCSEAEWGNAVVSPILRLISHLVDSTMMIEVLVSCEHPKPLGTENLILFFFSSRTTVLIQPESLAPVPSKRPQPGKPRTKKIDYILGLELNEEEKEELRQRSAYVDPEFQSLNQSRHKSINKCPNFLDIEVKRLDGRDSKVQLGVWAAAGYKKKRLHGWSTELPILALGVQDHEWRLHVGSCFHQKLVSKKCCPVLS